MKKIILLCITVLALLSSCKPASVGGIQTGDLVFIALPASYHLYNRDYVTSPDKPESFEDLLIHTAILDVDKEGVWIIDATLAHGVDRHPLDTMFSDFALKNGNSCDYIVMRLANNKQAKRYVANAKKHLGKKYNINFTPSDDALYCTELVRESYVDKKGNYLFEESPMDFTDREGNMPDYWTWLFGRLGKEVPQGVMGTLPQSMIQDPQLVRVDCQLTDYGNLAYDQTPVDTYLTAIEDYLANAIGTQYATAETCIPFYNIVSVDDSNPDDIQVLGDFWVMNYNQAGDTLKMVSGGSHPGKMHVRKISDTRFEVTGFDQVGDGSTFLPTAKRIFGDKFDAFSAIQSDDQKREAVRKESVKEYVEHHNLPVKYYQDYGWPAVNIKD
jgi:hypothetical protein